MNSIVKTDPNTKEIVLVGGRTLNGVVPAVSLNQAAIYLDNLKVTMGKSITYVIVDLHQSLHDAEHMKLSNSLIEEIEIAVNKLSSGHYLSIFYVSAPSSSNNNPQFMEIKRELGSKPTGGVTYMPDTCTWSFIKPYTNGTLSLS